MNISSHLELNIYNISLSLLAKCHVGDTLGMEVGAAGDFSSNTFYSRQLKMKIFRTSSLEIIFVQRFQ